SGRGYARYYSFTLAESTEVTIGLTSSVDTYLFLRSGSATSGTALHQNDDIVSGNTNSQIVATLSAGTYTIEATTYSPNTTGSFTLSVSGGGSGGESGTPVATGCEPAPLTLPASGISGTWADDCESSVSGRGYARYYSFTLAAETEVTIDLTSSVDTYLFLRSGSATSGTALHQNDDIGGTNRNSQIVATLSAGAYTIEATTYSPSTTGSFTLSVAGGDGGSSGTATGCNGMQRGAAHAACQRGVGKLGGRLRVQRNEPRVRALLQLHAEREHRGHHRPGVQRGHLPVPALGECDFGHGPAPER
ncbi:MAG: PPC domain-containing protein, partial [Dehalococcoidia bacterium]|nr:PPC domain-containing protein [Dehalococcoidia bacterium]